MAGLVCIGTLAAFGLLCVLWLIYGLCCGKPEGSVLICSGGEQGLIRRCLWLREMGLLSCPMVLINPELDEMDVLWLKSKGIEIWSAFPLGKADNIGEKKYGAGTGDPSGCHQCGGVSEL